MNINGCLNNIKVQIIHRIINSSGIEMKTLCICIMYMYTVTNLCINKIKCTSKIIND